MLLLALAMAPAPFDWTLTAEKTSFRQTGRYEEALRFCEELDRVSDKASLIRLGKSPEGREMVVLLLSTDPQVRHAEHRTKPLVYIESGIHSGEIEGKDATLMLARQVIRPAGAPSEVNRSALLDSVSIAILPVFSVDAHERMSPYNRVNQNGPEEMGWRATSENINLNRDWVKADAREMRNLLAYLSDARPDFYIDNHTTDGGDWQYMVQYDVPRYPTMAPETVAISQKYVDDVTPRVDADGWLTAPYFGGFDEHNPQRPITIGAFGPRYSTGYWALRNRPSLLVETHVLKPYGDRVKATYSFNLHTLEWAGQNASALMRANRRADAQSASLAEGSTLAVSARTTDAERPFVFKGLKFDPYTSNVTGAEIPRWTREKVDHPTTIRDQYAVAQSVELPAGYLVPGYLTEVINLLKLHGVKLTPVNAAITNQAIELSAQQFFDVKLPGTTFESRTMPNYQLRTVTRTVTIPAGSIVVPINQPLVRLVAQMLEPSAPDSLAKWGQFNIFLESKEYAEDYAMEPIAKKMLESDPELRAEFEARLRDPEFARNPDARLNFFYERSPWFDSRYRIHPVYRLDAAQLGRLSGSG